MEGLATSSIGTGAKIGTGAGSGEAGDVVVTVVGLEAELWNLSSKLRLKACKAEYKDPPG
jgi:hypothetical protein